jgi:ketosteroid isomerase-like protein
MSGDVASIREILDAWNRGDIEGVVARTAEDIVWVPVTVATVEGQSGFRGRDGFRQFFEQWRETWETWNIELHECREVGDRIVALGHVRARGRGSGVELDTPVAYIFEFREGLVERGQSFFDHEEALAAAERRKEHA